VLSGCRRERSAGCGSSNVQPGPLLNVVCVAREMLTPLERLAETVEWLWEQVPDAKTARRSKCAQLALCDATG
jgi:hypothetical protein